MKYIVLCSLLMCARGLRIHDEQPANNRGPSPKYKCAFNETENEDLSVYTRLFKQWSGQTILIAGDSLAFQMFNLLRCGAGALGWKHDVEEVSVYYTSGEDTGVGFVKRHVAAEHFPVEQIKAELMWLVENELENDVQQGVLTKSSIRPNDGSSPVVLYMYFFYTLKVDAPKNYRDAAPLPPAFFESRKPISYWKTKPAALIDVVVSIPVDRIFTNLGHHGHKLTDQFVREIDTVLHMFKAAILAAETLPVRKRPTLAILSHPPQHFNNPTGTGDYIIGQTDKLQPCSKDVGPGIWDQAVMKNNRLKRKKAAEYGFQSADFSYSMIHYGDMHLPWYEDCTHYILSPVPWAGAIRSIMDA